MTVPPAPFPKTANLFRALASVESSGVLWADNSDEVSIFTRGRVALAAGIEILRKERRARNVHVWIPGYFCNEALEVLRNQDVVFDFYPVREDLSPDWDAVQPEAPKASTLHAFLLVHYFGFPNDAAAARKFCDANSMVLIEDAAHMIRPLEGPGLADMVLFTPWKLFAVPSGGVLWRPRGRLGSESPAGDILSMQSFWWLAIRSIQKLCVKLHLSWHALYRYRRGSPVESSNRRVPSLRCDTYALRLMQLAWLQVDEVIRRRRENFQTLAELSKEIDGIRCLVAGVPASVCPYGLPFLLDSPSSTVVDRLEKSGIPASRWPDLPPEVIADPIKHRTALDIFDRLLLLPVHQSLSARDLTRIGDALRSTLLR
jgi:hypothetical protein